MKCKAAVHFKPIEMKQLCARENDMKHFEIILSLFWQLHSHGNGEIIPKSSTRAIIIKLHLLVYVCVLYANGESFACVKLHQHGRQHGESIFADAK